MADKKITALTALTATTKDSAADLLHIIDYSAAPVNKKITIAELFSNVNTDTHIYGVSKTFEIGSTATTNSAIAVTTGSNATLTSSIQSEVVINNDQSRHIDFTVKSAQSAKAIYVESDYVTGDAGPGIVFINGDAGNQDFCVKGDDWDSSANDPVLFSDASFNAAGLGTAVLDGNYCVQVAAGPNAAADKHSAQFQGNIAFSGVEDLQTTGSNASVTLSAYKTVHKINVNDATNVTYELPTTGCVDGQIKIIYIDADTGGATITIADTNRAGTLAFTLQDDGDSWIGIYESGSSKWVNLAQKNVG